MSQQVDASPLHVAALEEMCSFVEKKIISSPKKTEAKPPVTEPSTMVSLKANPLPIKTSLPPQLATDIFNISNISLTDHDKKYLIDTRCPPPNASMPGKEYKDKRKKGGITKRYCQPKWFAEYRWLAYSSSTAGLGCLACCLFPSEAKYGQSQVFISKPYSNWKDAQPDLQRHAASQYHKWSEAKLKAFIATSNQPHRRIDSVLVREEKELVEKNRQVIKVILRGLIFCGRYGLALRGHRDDNLPDDLENKGVFAGVLKLMMESGDTVLEDHLKTAARNSTYISKTAQNDLLDCLRIAIQADIVQEIKEQAMGPLYSISADEVTDVSGWEQLGLVVRYTKHGMPQERLLTYMQCANITGEALCNDVVSVLKDLGLNPQDCCFQNYDGAGNMAGQQRGLAARFNAMEGNNAPYIHCASHALNLVLCHASKVKAIHCMMENLRFMGRFFEWPKRLRILEKHIDAWCEERPEHATSKRRLTTMCQTRWVEKHTCIEDTHTLYEPVVKTLHDIDMQPKQWEGKAHAEAAGLYNTMISSDFLAGFETTRYLFGFTKQLSLILQRRNLDIIEAKKEVDLVTKTLQRVRENGEEVFSKVYKEMEKKASMTGNDIEIKKPRICSRQILRNNVESDSPETYYRRCVFLEMLDTLVQELNGRYVCCD